MIAHLAFEIATKDEFYFDVDRAKRGAVLHGLAKRVGIVENFVYDLHG